VFDFRKNLAFADNMQNVIVHILIILGMNFFFLLYIFIVYSVFNLKNEHTYWTFIRAFIHHSVTPFVLVHNPRSNNIFGPGRCNIQIRGYPLDLFYNWDTI
jgi:hypothetical protein